MKYVILLLSEATKLDFAGADKLTKSDHIVLVHVKGNKAIPASLTETFEGIKATVDYFEIAKTADNWLTVSYLIGYHVASKHDVYVVTKDKTKIPTKLASDIHVYTGFKSITASTSSKSSTTKKSSTKSTAKKTSTTSSKKTTSKSTAKKTTTTKKTTSKTKSATSEKASTASSKKKETSVLDVLGSLATGDSKKVTEGLSDLAGQFFGTKK